MGIENNKKILSQVLKISGAIALFYSVSLLSLNDKQKEANRDLHGGKHSCMYPGCNRKFVSTAHVHHIIPQGFAIEILGMSPDHATNLVPICAWHHLGYETYGAESQVNPKDWDPIHPDNTFASLLSSGRLKYVSNDYKKKYPEIYKYYFEIAQEFQHIPLKHLRSRLPHVYAKYVQLGVDMGVDEIIEAVNSGDASDPEKFLDIVHKVVMRKLRKTKLFDKTKREDQRIYWMPDHDPELQITAITKVVEGMKQKNWNFPLRFLNYGTRKYTGQYVWDSMAAILVERHVFSLSKSRTGLTRIFKEMRAKRKPSWKIYFDSIYTPAVRGYQKDMKVGEVLQEYLNSLSEASYKNIVGKYNKANRDENRNQTFNVLNRYFLKPAVNYQKNLKRKKKSALVESSKAAKNNSKPATSSFATGGLRNRF